MSSGDGIVAVYPNDPSLTLSGSAWATVSESNTTLAFAEGAAKGSLKFTGTTFTVYPIKNTHTATNRYPGSGRWCD